MKNHIKYALSFVLICTIACGIPRISRGAAYSGLALFAEFESCIVDSSAWRKKGASSTSGNYYAESAVANTSGSNITAQLSYDFSLEEATVCNIWIRARAINAASDSAYISVDGGQFANVSFEIDTDGKYLWKQFKAQYSLGAGSHNISISSREAGLRLDQMLITSNLTFVPEGVCSEVTDDVSIVEGKWQKPSVNPPENLHPRVYFTPDKIPSIIENMDAEENSYAASMFLKYVNEPLPSTDYRLNTLAAIESKALYACLFDDELAAKASNEAIAAIETIAQMKPNESDGLGWRRYGEMIQVLAEIYDWCYYDLYDEQKDRIIKLCVQYASKTEMGWPPSELSGINGHGSEFQLIRDMMAFAIATYDERPDFWEYIGGRFYEEYVPIREFRLEGHYNMQGTNYGYYRLEADAYAYALITSMGAPEPYSGYDLAGTGYSELYMRRPDGNWFYDGDIYTDTILPSEYLSNEKDGMLIKSYAAKDGVLKGEYFRRTLYSEDGIIKQNPGDTSPVMQLILSDPSVKVVSFHTLPKSRYFDTPVGMMVARTGWEEGYSSDTVSAMMKIGEYSYGNHQHQDNGTFQIYYKGLLAGKGGNYDLYGTDQHRMYTTKSISHNTLLIYDPSEDKGTIDRYNVNDGGQIFPVVSDSPVKMGEVLSHEIDPTDTIDPDYTYIKGDITDSYSDKVEAVQRSMMFINLKNEDIPAAFIVYDKVISADPTFKKTWVLHGTQSPALSGARAVFTAENSGLEALPGVMTIDTLLPDSGNLTSEVIGSPEDGFGIVNSYKYNSSSKKWTITKSKNYVPGTDEENEVHTYRLELSPKTVATEDVFFNVMLIGDKEAEFKPELIDTGSFYGTKIYQKAVFFGKASQNDSFSYKSDGTCDYIICDMKPGTYLVSSDSGTQQVCVSKEGNVLSFSAEGNVSARWQSEEYIVPEDKSKEAEQRLYVKSGNSFTSSFPGDEYTNAKEFAQALGYTAKQTSPDTLAIYSGDEEVAQLTAESNLSKTSRGIVTLTLPCTKNEDGALMASPEDLLKVMFTDDIYDGYSGILFDTGLSYDFGPYITGSVYTHNGANSLILTAYPHNAGKMNLLPALYSGDRLVASGIMNSSNDYTWSASFEDTENLKVKIFLWGEKLYPVSIPVNLNYMYGNNIEKHYTLQSGNGTNTLKVVAYGSASDRHTAVSSKHNSATITKANGSSYMASYIDLGTNTNYYMGDDAEYGYVHYSSLVEVTDLITQTEAPQLRIRGTKDGVTTVKSINLPKEEGSVYKLDSITDLSEYVVYVYINGEFYGTVDISDWEIFRRPEHYIVYNTGIAGSTMKVISPTVTVYSADAELKDITDNLINRVYNQTNIVLE